jgi:hypothetical protein
MEHGKIFIEHIFYIIERRKGQGESPNLWLHERYGKSEEAHRVMKDDMAGGKLPSD